jgi:hypothetical protein
MAVSGRKAQIAFYGSDICFELILDIARDIGPGQKALLLDTYSSLTGWRRLLDRFIPVEGVRGHHE